MNRLEAMGLFIRVAELGSFSAVAVQLGIARSAVTRQITALEAHLGAKLMVRSTRRLSLTSAGAVYLEQCRAILKLVDDAETGITEGRTTLSGPIRISVPLSFGLRRLTPLLLEFSETYPEIKLSIDFSDRQLDLIQENIDLSIRIMAVPADGEIVRKLGQCQLMTVAAPQYLKQHGCPLHPSELQQHQCLGYSPHTNNRPWSFQIAGQVESIYLPFRLQANNGDALTEAAVRGLGITLQPDFIVAEHLKSGALESILEAFSPPSLGIYALLPSNRYIPQRIRTLIDFLSQHLGINP